MDASTARTLVCATALAVALGACSTPPAPPAPPTPSLQVAAPRDESITSDREDQASADEGTVCTEIGNAEGVGVDLADVLDLEGGDCFAEVSVPAQGASGITGFAGNDGYAPGGNVLLDLDGSPVTVDVVVRTQDGREVCTASGTTTPRLFRPNGARCDGKNYSLSLLTTTSGDLVPLPPGSRGPRLDARGREPVVVDTACGIERLDMIEGSYARIGGVLGGPEGPPPGWNDPRQRGWATRSGDQIVYTDDAGHRETFRLEPGLELQAACG